MGHNRRKQQQKAGRVTYQPKNSQQKSSINIQKKHKYDDNELMEEALLAQEVIVMSDQAVENNLLDLVYLVDMEWWYDWQDYIGFEEVVTGQDATKSKYFNKNRPKEINRKMLVDQKKNGSFLQFSKDNQEYSFLNTVMEDSNPYEDHDVKLVSKELWEFLEQRYGGNEIQRPVIQTDKKASKPLLKVHKPDIFFVGDRQIEFLQCQEESQIRKMKCSEIFNIKQMQIPAFWKVGDLKKCLLNYIQENQDIYDQDLDIRVWKLDSYLTFEQLKLGLYDTISRKAYSMKGIELTNNEEYENWYFGKYMKSSYIIMIELFSLNEGKFLFSQSTKNQGPIKVDGKPKGYCENCIENKPLEITCLCKKVFYCSDDCIYRDKQLHSRICELAYDSDDDEELEQKEVNFDQLEKKKGLHNIGNTCYMNSGLQCMAASLDFTNFYTSNQFREQLKEQGYKKSLLSYKYSKLLKNQFTMGVDKDLAPYAFKAQIGKICSMFKGFSQQDSQEFLNITLDALNEQLLDYNEINQNGENNVQEDEEEQQQENVCEQQQKDNKQYSIISRNYSTVIKDNFLGLFKSVITCPVCCYQSQNYESFTIVPVPIPFKAAINFLPLFYIPKDIQKQPEFITLQYGQNSEVLKDILKKTGEQFQVDWEQLLPAIITQDSIDSFYFKKDVDQNKVKDVARKLGNTKFLGVYEMGVKLEEINSQEDIIQVSYSSECVITGGYASVESCATPRIFVKDSQNKVASLYRNVYELLGEDYNEQQSVLEGMLHQEQIEEEEQKVEEEEIQQQDQNGDCCQEEHLNNGDQQKENTDSNQDQKQNSSEQEKQNGEQQKNTEENKEEPKQQQQEEEEEEEKPKSNGWGGWDDIPTIPKKQAKKANNNTNGNSSNNSKQQEQNKSNNNNNNTSSSKQNGSENQKSQIQQQNNNKQQQQQNNNSNGQQQKGQQSKNQDSQKQNNNNKEKEQQQQQQNNGEEQKPKKQNNTWSMGWDDEPVIQQKQQEKIYQQKQDTKTSDNNNSSTKATSNGKQQISSSNGWEDEDETSEEKKALLKKEKEKKEKERLEKERIQKEQQLKKLIQEEKKKGQEFMKSQNFKLGINTVKKKKVKKWVCSICDQPGCSKCEIPFNNQESIKQWLDQIRYRNQLKLEVFWKSNDQVPQYIKTNKIDPKQISQQSQENKNINCPSIMESLQQFQAPEVLSEENMWHCDKCNVKQQAFKSLQVNQCGKYLILQIKRFRNNEKGEKVKNSQMVVYEEKINLRNIVQNVTTDCDQQKHQQINEFRDKFGYDCQLQEGIDIDYELYGVILHEGTINSGHYIALTKQRDGKWYKFDDEEVTQVDQSQVIDNKDAYILFYQVVRK